MGTPKSFKIPFILMASHAAMIVPLYLASMPDNAIVKLFLVAPRYVSLAKEEDEVF